MARAISMAEADPKWVASCLSFIADNLRDQDRDELTAMHGEADPRVILAQSAILSSHGWIVVDPAGDPQAVFGAAPSPLPGVGIVWMLGTNGVRRNGHSIARQTREYLDQMAEAYPILWNYIDARNTVSMRWLRWGGFELIAEHRQPSGHLFHIFARNTPCVIR